MVGVTNTRQESPENGQNGGQESELLKQLTRAVSAAFVLSAELVRVSDALEAASEAAGTLATELTKARNMQADLDGIP